MDPAPLSGLRVVDLATPRAELAGRILADLGAEVIKIEPPGGAAARQRPPFIVGRETDPEGSLYWAFVARGKRSMVLDIRAAADRDRLWPLLDGADVFIESEDPGVLAALGLGYHAVAARNPALIYLSVTPYGQTGPAAHRPATELTLEAAAGQVGAQGDPDRPPIPVGFPQAAFQAGALAAGDCLVALLERERSGRGQWLDLSMQEAMIFSLLHLSGWPSFTGHDMPGTAAERAHPAPPIPGVEARSVFACRDGYAVLSATLPSMGGPSFHAMMRWAEAEGRVPEPLRGLDWRQWMLDGLEGRRSAAEINAAFDCIAALIAAKSKRELMERALREDILLAPIATTADLLADSHLHHRGFWVEVGGVTHPGPFTHFGRTPLRVERPAPVLGEAQALTAAAPRRPSAPAAASGERTAALAGVKVLDFTWIGAGPRATRVLADHGATVIKVESEVRPDSLRLAGPFKDEVPGLNRSQFFGNFNTSKYGVAINLSKPEGRALARRLAIEWADVVVENFTPGTMERLGLDYASLSRERPDLIMLSTSLRGQTGPERLYAGFGGQGAALAGLHAITGWPDRPPGGPWGTYTDSVAPRFDAIALLSALFYRARTGQGQYVETSQTEAAMQFLGPLILDYAVNGRVAGAVGLDSLVACPHGTYRTEGTERYVAIAVESAAQWRALRALAPLDAFADPAFDALAARLARRDAIDAALRAWTLGQSPWALVDRLAAAGVPAAVVQWPSDLYHDPQLRHRAFFQTAVHAEVGEVPYDGFATHFSVTPARLHRAAPCLGQHTEAVLMEIVGLGPEDIAACAAAGALT